MGGPLVTSTRHSMPSLTERLKGGIEGFIFLGVLAVLAGGAYYSHSQRPNNLSQTRPASQASRPATRSSLYEGLPREAIKYDRNGNGMESNEWKEFFRDYGINKK